MCIRGSRERVFVMSYEGIAKLVTTRPEAEIAADIKRRAEVPLAQVAALMDEAAQHGLQMTWDNFTAGPPTMRYRVNGLRLIKFY